MPYAQFLRRLETISKKLRQEHYEKWSLGGFIGWIYYILQPTGKKKVQKVGLTKFLEMVGLYAPRYGNKSVLEDEKRRSKEIVDRAIKAWDKAFGKKD